MLKFIQSRMSHSMPQARAAKGMAYFGVAALLAMSGSMATEVRNAQAAKRAGKLDTNGDYAANALKRCDAFKDADDQSACKARVMNSAGAAGSVAAGGVLREVEVLVPAQ